MPAIGKFSRGLKSCVFTFSNHPKNLIPGAKPVKNIIYREEKAALIEQMGVDYLVDIPFTEGIMTMEPERFVKELLVDAMHAKELFCGFNYHFGYRGQGDVQKLRIPFCYPFPEKSFCYFFIKIL